MANLVEYSLLNGVDNDLNAAIQAVGGNTDEAVGVVDLAPVIRSQLVSNKAVGEGIYDNWLFGTPDTNTIFEEPTGSTNAVQAKTVAESIKEVYETMINSHKSLVYIVNKLPETEKSLSAIYLLKHIIPEASVRTVHVLLNENISYLEGHIGNVSYDPDTRVMTFKPDTDGTINAICGWNNLDYYLEEFDRLVINTNIKIWGKTGVSYSFDGKNFYKINADRIVLTPMMLNEMGIRRLSKFILQVESVNETDNCTKIFIDNIQLSVLKDNTITYSVHYYAKEGDKIRQVDCGETSIDFNQLFYATREEFLENKARTNSYMIALEDMLRKQFGSFMNSGSVSIEDSIKELQAKCDELDKISDDVVKKTDIATQTSAGLMSVEDKRKLDSIATMEYDDLDDILTM